MTPGLFLCAGRIAAFLVNVLALPPRWFGRLHRGQFLFDVKSVHTTLWRQMLFTWTS